MKFASAGENLKKFFGLDFAVDSDQTSNDQQESFRVHETSNQSNGQQVAQLKNEIPTKSSLNSGQTKNIQDKSIKNESKVVSTTPKNTKTSVYDHTKETKILSIEQATNKNQKYNMNKRVSENPINEEAIKKITIIEPRTYAEVQTIANAFFRNEIVIVNFHLVDESQARRIVDFLTGAVFALDGDIQRLDSEMFICIPSNLEVDSETAESLIKSHLV